MLMMTIRSTGTSRSRALATVLGVGAVLLFADDARAHIRLTQPPSWIEQDTLGDPQKNEPCGSSATVPGTPTNVITPFAAGQQITVEWEEVIPHDGWFRIAVSYNDRADLKDPVVQVDQDMIAIDASVVDPPVLPVLADHLFPHAASSITPPKMYSTTVTLPTQTCTKCTLQVIQFMSAHGPNPSNSTDGQYIYHKCADISIEGGADGATATTTGSSGTAGTGDASSAATPINDSGCGCAIPRRSKPSLAALGAFVAFAWAASRRRRGM